MPWIHEEFSLNVILLCRNRFVEYYLEKGFVILAHNPKNLSIVPNEAKQIIHAINIHTLDFVMDCYTEIYSVANTKNKLNTLSDLYYGYIQNFYQNEKYITDELFCQYIKHLLKYFDHPALIK